MCWPYDDDVYGGYVLQGCSNVLQLVQVFVGSRGVVDTHVNLVLLAFRLTW